MMQEKELLEKSKQGDVEAFTQLIAPYSTSIYHLCLKMVKDESSAEDLTQDALLKAYQHLQGFQGRAKFATWLYKIAYNLSLNYLKKKSRRHEEEFKELFFAAPLPEEAAEVAEWLKDALETLSPKLRIVFEMYEIEKMAQKEIAAKLAIAEGTVRSRLYYARRKIRNALDLKNPGI